MVNDMKPRYVPNLQDAAAVCTANFIKLQRLFPDNTVGSSREIDLVRGSTSLGSASFRVMERFPFTTTITFNYQCHVLIEPQAFHVRIYDDACMAEVVLSEAGQQLAGVYPYPNQKMYHQDEKHQLNRMLSEALGVCIAQGISQVTPVI